MPRIEAAAQGVTVEASWLDSYRHMTASPASDALPLLAPQILAGPLHAKILSDAAMPVGVLGLVHVSNVVQQHAPVPVHKPLDLRVWVQGSRVARQGAELDIHTTVHVDGELVWEGVTTALARGPWGDEAAPSAPAEGDVLEAEPQRWDVPSNVGRQWRRVSGDPNPIHLHKWLARPFGFKAAIAHGTWMLARASGLLGEATGPATLTARFRRPVFLPATPEFRVQTNGSKRTFELRDPARDRRHFEGELIHNP
ncbi:MAG: MaoC family dehydratase [Myxococcota bacterium]